MIILLWDEDYPAIIISKKNILKSSNYQNLVDQAKTMFKELDPTNDLTFLRIRTKVILSMFGPHSILPKYTLILKLFFRSMRSWWLRTGTTCLLWSKTPRMPRHAFIILLINCCFKSLCQRSSLPFNPKLIPLFSIDFCFGRYFVSTN